MKYLGKEISELHDLVIIQTLNQFKAAEDKRAEASKHWKFSKDNAKNVGEFPTPNPAFLELKNELENEMKKRKL